MGMNDLKKNWISQILIEFTSIYVLGWSDFRKKMLGTCHVVVDCSGTSNPKFYFDLLLFHPAHGKTRPQKTPKIPQKDLKSAKKICILHL